MKLILLYLPFAFPSSRSFAFQTHRVHPSQNSAADFAMTSNDQEQPTQGTKLAEFYGSETATMYAGMMEEEMVKYRDDFDMIFDTLRNEFPSGSSGSPVPIRVLDTCCGSCHMLQYIGENFANDDDRKCELMGTDLSEEMIKVGTNVAPLAKLKVGNMLDMSQEKEDERYHLILNNFAMHHATPGQAKEAICEYARLLVPGGLLYFSAWEGEGKIDYGGMDMNALFHGEDAIKSWVETEKNGLKIRLCRTFVEEEMGDMNSIYIIAQKQRKP